MDCLREPCKDASTRTCAGFGRLPPHIHVMTKALVGVSPSSHQICGFWVVTSFAAVPFFRTHAPASYRALARAMVQPSEYNTGSAIGGFQIPVPTQCPKKHCLLQGVGVVQIDGEVTILSSMGSSAGYLTSIHGRSACPIRGIMRSTSQFCEVELYPATCNAEGFIPTDYSVTPLGLLPNNTINAGFRWVCISFIWILGLSEYDLV